MNRLRSDRPLARELLRATRNGGAKDTLRKAAEVIRGRWYLRRATSPGNARLQGRVKVVNNGRIILGERLRLDGTTVPIELVANHGTLSIGDRTYINYGTNISSTTAVTIGKNCLIGQYCIIMDDDYHDAEDREKPGPRAPVVIEDDVWLGARVIVMQGSHIGAGAVIGANSVVRGYIPPYTIAAGSPAKVVRELNKR